MKRIIGPVFSAFVTLGLVIGPLTANASPTPNPGCTPNVVPIGQANPPGSQLEPLAPIWCFNLNPPNPPTRVTGANDWSDNFDGVAQSGRFQDGDYDYRIFTAVNAGACATFHTQHFTNNQHWMDDNTRNGTCGSLMRPNRSFHFENGMLVVEQDVAANVSGYNGDTWPEIDISTGAAPTGNVVDNLYGYGQFGGNWTIGCRLQTTNPICSVENAASNVTNRDDKPPCFRSAPARVSEISSFEVCGAVHSGFDAANPENRMRSCSSEAQEPDMMCRDRFRIELTGSSIKLYVNGQLYGEDSNWPAEAQIDPAVIASGQWYVYATDWQGNGDDAAYRFHWDNFVVNPHNPDGTFRAPSAAPNYCLGQPMNTCEMGTPPPAPVVAPQAPNPTPQDFSTSATVSSGSISRGASVSLTASVKSANTTNARVTLEVDDASGNQAFQQTWDNSSFTAGQTRTFTANWSVPSSAATGAYTIRVGASAIDNGFDVN
jgi:hypothetical protein